MRRGFTMTVKEIAQKAKEASMHVAHMGIDVKNAVLLAMANALQQSIDAILKENEKDVKAAQQSAMPKHMIDRLMLTEARINDMANGLRSISELEDPVGETLHMWRRPNGLNIGQVRVPFGVIGIIYEARPNVTADAIGLCIKASSAVVLRGGSDAINSNKAIADVMAEAAYAAGLRQGAIQLIEDTSRESAREMMQLNGLIDVLIPRGGAGLIESVVKNATIPVIETGTGNCHIYVDKSADLNMALEILINAKTSRPSVCNAAESLLVHESIAHAFLPMCVNALIDGGVEIRGDRSFMDCSGHVKEAQDEDYFEEYTDLIISAKVVKSLDEAIDHINKYGTHHSDAIITSDYSASQKFLRMVDSAAVYVNASTRFTDGFEFGFGAEIGISTQKLHARGPMGIKEMTTTKYVIYGDGQVR